MGGGGFERLPYPGLRAFTRDESDLFFGREGSIDAMVDRLGATRFLAVLGPSGSGKSSLVRTGLLDALDLGLLPQAGSRWMIADLHPGGQPIRKLAAALLQASEDSPVAPEDVAEFASVLGEGPRSIAKWAAAGNLPTGANLLILVDQFEELFRYGDYAQREEAEAFVALLLESASGRNAAIYVVITMRSEYLGACATIPGLAEQISAGLYLTPRMDREECREAIEGPAGVVGFTVHPALVSRLLNDLGSFAPWELEEDTDLAGHLSRQADQLPLMQHVLNRLWVRARRENGQDAVELKLSDYDRLGGLSGALDMHGAEIMAALGPDLEDAVQSVFRALVTGTSLALAVRRPCRLGELVECAGGARDSVLKVLEAFRASDCNFIRSSDALLNSDDVILDISHESLIRQWTPLRNWLDKEIRDGLAWRRLISAEERYSQGKSDLLRGTDLLNIAGWWRTANPTAVWASRHGGQFAAARAFLEASERAESSALNAERKRLKRERQRLMAGIAVLAVALAFTLNLAIIAHKRRQAGDTLNRQLRKQQQMLAESNRQLKRETLSLEAQTQAAKYERDAAIKADHRTAAVLESVSNVLYSPRYEGLIGLTELQSEMMNTLGDHQRELIKSQSEVRQPSYISVENQYRMGETFAKNGKARDAMRSYRDGYLTALKALQALPPGQPPDDLLTESFLEDAYRYAWYLADTGDEKQSDRVLDQLEMSVGKYASKARSARLLLGYGRLENLKSRYYSRQGQTDLQKRARLAAVNFADRAMAANKEPDVPAMYFAVQMYHNVSYDLTGEQKRTASAKGCKIADRMFAKSPLDRNAILARVSCLQDEAIDAVSPGSGSPSANSASINKVGAAGRELAASTPADKAADAAKILNQAQEIVYAGLRLAPDDQDLLLCMAELENSMADLSFNQDGPDPALLKHRIAAIDYFVRALKGRTLLQTSSNQLKNLYSNCTRVTFPDTAMEIRYYQDIAAALEATLDAFPRAPSFAVMGVSAFGHLGGLLEKDPARAHEAQTYLDRAIALYEVPGAIPDLATFSEDYYAFCGAYQKRADFYGKTGRPDLMLRDLDAMNGSCTAALDKYPWDFYLRFELIDSASSAGKVLFDLHRYTQAAAKLTYASHWGDKDSSELLARMYREGLGVGRDEGQAKGLETLASRQKEESYTFPADFGGTISKFKLYIEEWPADYRKKYPGIDDQVMWLKEARGGTISENVIEAFRKLQKIALDSDVSFPVLCEYAISHANDKDRDEAQVFEAAKKQFAQKPTAENLATLNTAASKLMKTKQPSDSDAIQSEVFEDARHLVIAKPDPASYREAWSTAIDEGDNLKSRHPKMADEAFAWSADLADLLPDDNADDLYRRLVSYERIGDRAAEKGDQKTARDWYAKDVGICRKRYALDKSPGRLNDLWMATRRLSKALVALNLPTQAHGLEQEAVSLAEGLVESTPSRDSYREGWKIFEEEGDLRSKETDVAKRVFLRSSELAELLPEDNAEDLGKRVVSDERVGDIYADANQPREAIAWYTKEFEAAQKRFGLDASAKNLDSLRIAGDRLSKSQVGAGEPSYAVETEKKLAESAEKLVKGTPGTESYRAAEKIMLDEGDRLSGVDAAVAAQAYARCAELVSLLPEDNDDDLYSQVVSYERLGQDEAQRGKMEAARESYGSELEAARKLYQLDATAAHLRSLRIATSKLCETLVALKQQPQADALWSSLADAVDSLLKQSDVETDKTIREAGYAYAELAEGRAKAGNAMEARAGLLIGRKLGNRIRTDTPEDAYNRYLLFESVADATLKTSGQGDERRLAPRPDARSAYAEAARSLERYCDFLTASAPQRASDDDKDTYDHFGSLSWLYLLSGDFSKAIDAAHKGLQMKPDAKWIEANLAHGLLLMGNRREALRHYMNARDGKINARSVVETTAEDFRILRELGFKDAAMDSIVEEMAKK